MTLKPHMERSATSVMEHGDANHILLDYFYTIILSVLIAVFLRLAGIPFRHRVAALPERHIK